MTFCKFETGNYRSRTEKVLVDAEQWVPGKAVKGVRVYGELAFLDKLDADVPVEPGDWIVRTQLGGLFAVSDAVFNRIYEAA